MTVMVNKFWPHRYNLNTGNKQKRAMENARFFDVLEMSWYLEKRENRDSVFITKVRFQ